MPLSANDRAGCSFRNRPERCPPPLRLRPVEALRRAELRIASAILTTLQFFLPKIHPVPYRAEMKSFGKAMSLAGAFGGLTMRLLMIIALGGTALSLSACGVPIACPPGTPGPCYSSPAPVVVEAAPPGVYTDEYGVTWANGQPYVVEDGAEVAVVFEANYGWGYWDRFHHWRGAPGRSAEHMERMHPHGAGFVPGHPLPQGEFHAGPAAHPGMNPQPAAPGRMGAGPGSAPPSAQNHPAQPDMRQQAAHGPVAAAPQQQRRACGGPGQPKC